MFTFELANRGAVDQRVNLALEGHNRDWARVAGTDAPSIPSKESRNVTLVVDAPDDAGPGERAELFLVAENVDDPNVVPSAVYARPSSTPRSKTSPTNRPQTR